MTADALVDSWDFLPDQSQRSVVASAVAVCLRFIHRQPAWVDREQLYLVELPMIILQGLDKGFKTPGTLTVFSKRKLVDYLRIAYPKSRQNFKLWNTLVSTDTDEVLSLRAADDTEQMVLTRLLDEQIWEAINRLHRQERSILVQLLVGEPGPTEGRRFEGRRGSGSLTLVDIARREGLCESRISQIAKSAKQKVLKELGALGTRLDEYPRSDGQRQ